MGRGIFLFFYKYYIWVFININEERLCRKGIFLINFIVRFRY